MKVGVFGGAFNPIHVGHLVVARDVAEACGLDKVIFVVAARPPHKNGEILIDAESRYAMAALACEGIPGFEVSDAELTREGPSYTVDTMRHFTRRYPGAAFILGQDAMEDIASWKSAALLLKTCDFIVVTRPGHDDDALIDVLQSTLSVSYKNLKLVDKTLPEEPVTTIGVVGAPTAIRLVRATPLDVSSTAIRERISAGRPITWLTPPAVERYLIDNHILRNA
jgi:nicotinate-nucleotide adenylyltransferase